MNLIESKLLPLFLSQSLRTAAVSLLSFFSAIYIYKQTSSFLTVFGFFLILYIFKIIGTCLAENLALKFGLKKQVLAGHFFTALCLLAFVASEKNFFFIWLAAIFWGMAIGFFWFGRHGLLAKIADREKYGQSLGWAGIIDTLFLLAIPFLGGVLINQLGYQALFLASLVFVSLGFLALMPLPEQKTHRDVTLREIIGLLKTHRKVALAYFSLGAIEAVYSTGLLLYIFLLLKKEMVLGGFFSLSMILVALVNFTVGRWIDKRGKRALIASGACFSSLVWLGRILAANPLGLFILDVIDRVAMGMLGMPLEVLTYEKALDGHSTGRAILFRETAIASGSVFSCFLLMGVVVLNLNLKFSFLVIAIFSLTPLLLVRGKGSKGV